MNATDAAKRDEDAQRELAAQLVERAGAAGVDLVGPGGLLTGLTKQVLEAARDEGLSDHLCVLPARPGRAQRGQLS